MRGRGFRPLVRRRARPAGARARRPQDLAAQRRCAIRRREETSGGRAGARASRRAIQRRARSRASREARPGDAAFAVLIVGVENLAELNRRYGYEAADEVIATVGRRLAGERARDRQGRPLRRRQVRAFCCPRAATSNWRSPRRASRSASTAEPIATSARTVARFGARRRGARAAPRTQRLPPVCSAPKRPSNRPPASRPLRGLHARPGDQRSASPRDRGRRRDRRRAQPAPRPPRLPAGGRRRRRARRVLRSAAAGASRGRRNRRPGGAISRSPKSWGWSTSSISACSNSRSTASSPNRLDGSRSIFSVATLRSPGWLDRLEGRARRPAGRGCAADRRDRRDAGARTGRRDRASARAR